MVEYDSFSEWLALYNQPILTNIALFLDIFTYFFLAIFLLYLVIIKKDRKRAVIICTTYLVLILLIPSLKFLFSEVRPCTAPWKIQCPIDESFPSGHAAALAVLVIAYLTTSFFPYALFAYVIVSLSRIYLGIHTFKDILAGTVLAFAIFLIIEKIYSHWIGKYYDLIKQPKRWNIGKT